MLELGSLITQTMVMKLFSVISIILTFLLPISNSYFSMIVLCILSVISLMSLYYLFMYFYMIPINKQSILIYLTQSLIVAHGLLLINRFFIEIWLQCFLVELTPHIEDNFEIICYLRQTFNLAIPWIIIIIEIMVFRTVLKMSPAVFLGMNVWKVKLVCALIPIMFPCIRLLTQTCNLSFIAELKEYSVHLSVKTKHEIYTKKSVPMVIGFDVLLLVLEMYNTFSCNRIPSVFRKNKVKPVNQVVSMIHFEKETEVTEEQIENCNDEHVLHLQSVATASFIEEEEKAIQFVSPRLDSNHVYKTSSNSNECVSKDDNGQEDDTSIASEKFDDESIDNVSYTHVNDAPDIDDMVENNKDLTNHMNQPTVLHLSKTNTFFSKPNVKTSRTKTKLKQPVSYGFVLIMAILLGLNIVLHFINVRINKNNVVSRIAHANYRIMIFNGPFIWLLSHQGAKKFASHRLKRSIVNTM